MPTSKKEAQEGAHAYARESGGLMGDAYKGISKRRVELESAGSKTTSLASGSAPTTVKTSPERASSVTYSKPEAGKKLSPAAIKRLSQ
jgi:hypothetical protein